MILAKISVEFNKAEFVTNDIGVKFYSLCIKILKTLTLKFLKFHSLKAVTYQISASLMLSTEFRGESFSVVKF